MGADSIEKIAERDTVIYSRLDRALQGSGRFTAFPSYLVSFNNQSMKDKENPRPGEGLSPEDRKKAADLVHHGGGNSGYGRQDEIGSWEIVGRRKEEARP